MARAVQNNKARTTNTSAQLTNFCLLTSLLHPLLLPPPCLFPPSSRPIRYPACRPSSVLLSVLTLVHSSTSSSTGSSCQETFKNLPVLVISYCLYCYFYALYASPAPHLVALHRPSHSTSKRTQDASISPLPRKRLYGSPLLPHARKHHQRRLAARAALDRQTQAYIHNWQRLPG